MRVIFQKPDDGRRCSWRAGLNDIEGTVNAQVQAWRDSHPTPVAGAQGHADPVEGTPAR